MGDHNVGMDGSATRELPLLPRGSVVFADLPSRALVLEALAPAIDTGLMRVQSALGAAVILVRDAELFETHVFTGDGGHSSGAEALDDVRSWPEAEVSAERLQAGLVDLCAALVRGEALYEDLRLEWTSWPRLLADLARRQLTYVVELSTPFGRGVTCIAAGRQLLSYTDIQTSLADPALLESLAAGGDGQVRVRRVPPAMFAAAVEAGAGAVVPPSARGDAGASPAPAAAEDPPRPVTTAAPVAPRKAAAQAATAEVPEAVAAGPAPRWPRPAPGEPHPVAHAASLATVPAAVATEAAEPAMSADLVDDAAIRPTIEVLLPDLSWAAPWQTPWRSESGELHVPAAETQLDAAATAVDVWEPEAVVGSALTQLTVVDVHVELREIAKRRLKRSASRVETALDSAAAQALPLDRVLEDLRSITIRGVMQPTIDAMVDEMTAVAGRRSA